jgi:hypothetical protein
MTGVIPWDVASPPKIGDFGEDEMSLKDYEIAHLKWLLDLTQQTAANRLEEIYKLRRELYG